MAEGDCGVTTTCPLSILSIALYSARTIMIDRLIYTYNWMRHPSQRDFLNMGEGIVSRAKRYSRFWQNHLALTKEFTEHAFESSNASGNLAVLGAGRLLDVDCERLADRFSTIDLYDNDPGALTVWKKATRPFPRKFKFNLLDLTGALDYWKRWLQGPQQLVEKLSTLPPLPAIPLEVGQYSTVLSLNLLGQIPLYWRDRVTESIANRSLNQAEQAALDESCRLLESQHINLLQNCGAQSVVLLSDSEYYYYEPNTVNWQVEPAVFEMELDHNQYQETLRDCWLWHLAPYGAEGSKYGEIHRVEARAYIANS